MRIQSLFFLISIFAPLSLWAQTDSQKTEMERIRASSTYLYVESSEQENAEAAKSEVLKKLSDLIMQNYGTSLPQTIDRSSLEGESEARQSISRKNFNPLVVEWDRRGRKFYAFAYIQKVEAQRYLALLATAPFRNTGQFTFADAYAKEQQIAISTAQGNLITQFQVNIETSQSSSISEVNGKVDEAFSSQTKAFSRMNLIGLKQLTFTVGEQAYAFVYISNEDKEESFAAARNKVISIVKEGEKQEGWGNYSRAAKQYYIAYILSDTYYKPIEYTFGDGTQSKNLKQVLKSRVEDYLQTVDIEIKPAYEIAEQNIVAPFIIKKGNDRMNDVIYQYEVQGYDYVNPVQYGRGKLEFTDFFPVERREIIPMRFQLDITEDMQANPTLAELAPTRKFVVVRPIEVDFSNVFKVTVEAIFNGIDVTFSLYTRNVVETTAKWSFGDGYEVVSLNPTHTYNEMRQFPVTVVVNGDDFLTDTKIVDLEQGILRSGQNAVMAAVASVSAVTVQPDLPTLTVAATDSMTTESMASVVVDSLKKASPDTTVIAVPDSAVVAETIVVVDTTKVEEVVVEKPVAPVVVKDTVVVKKVVEVAPQPVVEKDTKAIEKPEELADDVFKELMKYKSFRGLTTVLARKKEAGEIQFGNQKDIFDSSGAMVVVADQKKVYDYLLFAGNRYISLTTGEEIVNLSDKFKNKYQIWVQKTDK